MAIQRQNVHWPAVAATALALVAGAAMAPTRAQAEPGISPTDPRAPAPSAPANRPECQATTPGQATGATPGTRSLSDTLSACGGALTPPASGDSEMTVTPPEGSRTPVIRPNAPTPRPNVAP